ncbi:MAG: carbohydrate kinase family protein [Phycisphaerales bacterium JB063]
MTERQTTALATAAALRAFADTARQTPVLLGCDGFIDSIISVVDKRYGVDRYDPVPTIARFGEKISAAAGKSSNYELVTRQQKLGGNGPIMANAMASAGLKVDYIGAVGDPAGEGPHPIFADFANIATLHPIAAPAATDALEFSDGKLMIGKLESLNDVNQTQIDAVIGRERYARLVTQAKLVGIVNWSMCPLLGSVFDALADEILPGDADKPMVFIDLTDPEKRTEQDLKAALDEIANLATMTQVTLGLNLKEASQVAHVLGIEVNDGPGGEAELMIESTAGNIREAMGLRCCVVHPRRAAAGAMVDDAGEEHRATFFGPFIEHPKLSTGAGDNFNAGFCLGLLAGLPLDQMLCAGTATSGYYVRNAQSPTLTDLAGFCDALPEPE